MKLWKALAIALALPAVVVGGMLIFGPAALMGGTVRSNPVVTGQLRSLGGPFGDYTIQPTFCRTGGRGKFNFFRGSVLHVSRQGGLELGAIQVREIDDKVHQVTIVVPGKCRDPKDEGTCTFVKLQRRDCAGFDVLIEDNGRRLSHGSRVFGFDGHASLSCVLADGTAIEGDLTFRGCD